MPSNETHAKIVVDPDAWSRLDGPTLLLAGPGTGKTHQLARRIKFLIEKQHISPDEITVITFTREAAENMRRRIADEEKQDTFVTPDSRPRRITTMHSLCLDIVRTNAAAFGLPDDFQVMTDLTLRQILIRDAALLSGHTEHDANEAASIRQKALGPKSDSITEEILKTYERILRACNAIDYDDQILLACDLLSRESDLLERYTSNARHLLVDEYQDINEAQAKLIKLLSSANPSGLFAVGDDDQSIYGFRGGSPRFIRTFRDEYGPTANVVCLDLSRRCPEKIMLASLGVVKTFDDERLPKPSPSFEGKKCGGKPVQIRSVASERHEAQVIASIARQAGTSKTMLVLVPARQYAEPIKQELRRHGVSYDDATSVGESGFALLSVLHDWLNDSNNSFALRRCMEALCESDVTAIPSRRTRTPAKRATRIEYLTEIATLWNSVASEKSTLWEVLQERAKNGSDFLNDIHAHLVGLRDPATSDLGTFLARSTKELQPWPNREAFMKEVHAYLNEVRAHAPGGEGGIRIMTLQAAKGLEADVVCVVGLTEGILPRDDVSPSDLRETARLVFVSMSRAENELHLFHARKRDASLTYLSKSFNLQPSRYLDAIGKNHRQDHYHGAPSKKRGTRRQGST